MRHQPIQTVAVKSGIPCGCEARLEPVRERIRRRAWDLYCRRGRQGGTALEDWLQAERESDLAPLAGINEEDSDIRITACVPGVRATDLCVEALPAEIVVEVDRNGKVERCKRFPLPARIDPDRVVARLRGSELDVIAAKAKNC